MSERILIAEDEEVLRINLCEFLQQSGYEVEGVGDGKTALNRVLDSNYTLVIADIRMPGMDGIALLKGIVAERPETFVLIITAYASVESAVEALRFGAFDYLLGHDHRFGHAGFLPSLTPPYEALHYPHLLHFRGGAKMPVIPIDLRPFSCLCLVPVPIIFRSGIWKGTENYDGTMEQNYTLPKSKKLWVMQSLTKRGKGG